MPKHSFKIDISSKYIFYIVIFSIILFSSLFLIDKDKEVYEAFNEAINFEVNCESNIGSCIQGEEEKILAMEKKFVNIESHEYLNEEKRKELLNEIEIKKQRVKNWKNTYKCFGAKKWHKTKEECEKNFGKWDRPCQNDYECPFYQKNKNYPNERGRCKGGICDMPLNIQIVGYTKFKDGDAYKPYCHGCNADFKDAVNNTGLGPCCDEQRDRELYPNLKSPDYAFSGDEGDRKRNLQI